MEADPKKAEIDKLDQWFMEIDLSACPEVEFVDHRWRLVADVAVQPDFVVEAKREARP